MESSKFVEIKGIRYRKACGNRLFFSRTIDTLVFASIFFILVPKPITGPLDYLPRVAGQTVAIYFLIVHPFFLGIVGQSVGGLLTRLRVLTNEGKKPNMFILYLDVVLGAIGFDRGLSEIYVVEENKREV